MSQVDYNTLGYIGFLMMAILFAGAAIVGRVFTNEILRAIKELRADESKKGRTEQ